MIADAATVTAVFVWCAGTLGHFLLTDLWTRRYGLAETLDKRFFVTMVGGTALLVAGLHIVAVTTGLGIGTVFAWLALMHLAAWRHAPPRQPDFVTVGTDGGATRALEIAAVVALASIALGWILRAARTLEVSGTDAAHYHVPNAVNLALGASLFDLPPTSHLYPMGTSVLAAWFILPFGDALLVDLPMLLAFLVLAAGTAWLFRLTTGLSGLAWTTWPVLALFGTPLFRAASLMSADLMFAASAVTFVALAFEIIVERRLKRSSLLLAAAAAGLLAGVKTTGIIALVLFGLPAGILFAVLMLRRKATIEIQPALLYLSAAIALALATGGLWLVRNWWMWGSPVVPNGLTLFGIEVFRGVPFERTTYLSVLGDLARDPDYPLASRTIHYIGEWLTPWYLVALAPLALVPLDAALTALRGRSRSPSWRRLTLTVAVLGTMAPMLWLLVGAPWTSLEWTRGMALRYAQPWWALLPLVALIGLFPVSLPWYRRAWLALPGGIALAVTGLLALDRSAGPAFPPAPTWPTMALVAGVWVWWRYAPARLRRWSVGAALVVAPMTFAVWASGLDVALRTEAARAQPAVAPTRQIYDAALAWESNQGRECQSRRFFITTRLDDPMNLQEVAFTNLVFYAAREVAVTAAVSPLTTCDYVISSRPVLETSKGVDLLAALNPYGATVEIAEVLPFVLLGKR